MKKIVGVCLGIILLGLGTISAKADVFCFLTGDCGSIPRAPGDPHSFSIYDEDFEPLIHIDCSFCHYGTSDKKELLKRFDNDVSRVHWEKVFPQHKYELKEGQTIRWGNDKVTLVNGVLVGEARGGEVFISYPRNSVILKDLVGEPAVIYSRGFPTYELKPSPKSQ